MMRWFFRKRSAVPDGLERLDGKLISYAVRRDPEGEVVIGKDGRICAATEKLELRFLNGTVPFACPISTMQFGDLMSHNGVIITGDDEVTGTRISVVAYYKYYRQIKRGYDQ